MRALIAAADDAGYAAAVEGLAGLRRERMQRLVVSFLVPSRQDWADECCEGLPSYDYGPSDESRLLWCVMESARQVERLGDRARFGRSARLRWVVYTAIDGVGAAAAPALAEAIDEKVGEVRRMLLEALSVLPSDEAFRLLVERLEQPDVLPAVMEMGERFPVRAMRVLAEASGGTSKRARMVAGLLNAYAEARPELVAGLDGEVRAAVEAVRAARVAEVAVGDVPPALQKMVRTESQKALVKGEWCCRRFC
jgi:hypothetical protein